jgi:hypothetical protein
LAQDTVIIDRLVLVVTAFDIFPDESIATACSLTVGQTGICLELIAIIASLVVVLADFKIHPDEAITTTGINAFVETSVIVVSIRIVTVLPQRVHDAIAADVDLAIGSTIIGRALIAIIASLVVRLTFLDVSSDQSVAAGRK